MTERESAIKTTQEIIAEPLADFMMTYRACIGGVRTVLHCSYEEAQRLVQGVVDEGFRVSNTIIDITMEHPEWTPQQISEEIDRRLG